MFQPAGQHLVHIVHIAVAQSEVVLNVAVVGGGDERRDRRSEAVGHRDRDLDFLQSGGSVTGESDVLEYLEHLARQMADHQIERAHSHAHAGLEVSSRSLRLPVGLRVQNVQTFFVRCVAAANSKGALYEVDQILVLQKCEQRDHQQTFGVA